VADRNSKIRTPLVLSRRDLASYRLTFSLRHYLKLRFCPFSSNGLELHDSILYTLRIRHFASHYSTVHTLPTWMRQPRYTKQQPGDFRPQAKIQPSLAIRVTHGYRVKPIIYYKVGTWWYWVGY